MPQVTLIIAAKNLLGRTLGQASSTISRWAAGIAKFGLAAGAALAGAGAIAWRVGGRMVAAYIAAEKAANKLASVLKQTGYAAGFTSGELRKYASELQRTTGLSDDAIVSAQALLAGFGNIRGDEFKRATAAILDMSTVLQKTGQDAAAIEETTASLAKALADPEKGMARLARSGVVFSDSQQRVITYLAATGRTAEAQRMILAQLESQYGGAAQGVNENVRAMMLLKETFGDVQEQIGGAILNSEGFADTLNRITDALVKLSESGNIELWAQKIRESFAGILDVLMPVAGFLQKWVLKPLKDGTEAIGTFAGTLMGGGSIGDAYNAALDAREEQAAADAEALRIIKAQKAAKAAEAEATERAAMAAAQEADAQRKSQEYAQKKAAAALGMLAIEGKITQALQARAAVEKRIAEAQQDLQVLNEGPRNRAAELKQFQRDQKEREATYKSNAEFSARYLRIQRELARGGGITDKDARFYRAQNAYMQHQEAIAAKEREIAGLERLRDAIQSKQLDALVDIRETLVKNLQAAGSAT